MNLQSLLAPITKTVTFLLRPMLSGTSLCRTWSSGDYWCNLVLLSTPHPPIACSVCQETIQPAESCSTISRLAEGTKFASIIYYIFIYLYVTTSKQFSIVSEGFSSFNLWYFISFIGWCNLTRVATYFPLSVVYSPHIYKESQWPHSLLFVI